METTHLTVSGRGLVALPRLLNKALPDAQLLQVGPIAILYVEKMFWRNQTSVLSAIVFNVESDETCSITITSGGGQSGLLRVTLGAPASHNEELRDKISEICRGNSWEIVP